MGRVAVVGVLLQAAAAVGQPAPVPPSAPAELAPAIRSGTVVSQPLQPVAVPPPAAEPVLTLPPAPDPYREPLGGGWASAEFLLWWPKSQPLPPLAAGNAGGVPALGRPGTTLLLGGGPLEAEPIGGGRFTIGTALDCTRTVGIEGTYFFLGTRTLSATADGRPPTAVGVPFVNALTGAEDSLVVAAPGPSRTVLSAVASTRVQGAEMNLVASLLATDRLRLTGLAGYRYLQVHEGLRVEQTAVDLTGAALTTDQFDGHTRFSGGQLGIQAEFSKGAVFVEFVGKMAVGRSYEVVRVAGVTDGPAGVLPGGVFAQPSNAGRFVNSAFAVVPETAFKVGVQSAGRSRIYVGYNFLYLNEVVRPGDQIDRTLNPGLIPVRNPAMTAPGPDRPLAFLRRGDFWVQGLVIGVEARY